MMPNEVEESAEYDNYIGQKNETEGPKDLSDFLGLEEDLTDDDSWRKHWRNMPEFENNANPSFKSVMFHFRTEEDYKEFQDLIGQKMTVKTKSAWHPKLLRDENTLKRWIEE